MTAIQMDFTRTDQPGLLANNKGLKIKTNQMAGTLSKSKGPFLLRVPRLSVSLCENRERSVWVPADTHFQPREPIVQ